MAIGIAAIVVGYVAGGMQPSTVLIRLPSWINTSAWTWVSCRFPARAETSAIKSFSLPQAPVTCSLPKSALASRNFTTRLLSTEGSRERLCTEAIRFVICSAAPPTMTVKLHVAVLPDASAAEQLTTVTPVGNVLPDAGEQLTVGFGSQLSLAVALKLTIAPAALVADAVMLAGQLIVGGVASWGGSTTVAK